MKKCPYCAEEIQNDAIKCRHCGAGLIVKIFKVAPNSLADKMRLQKDDVLLSINGKVTHSFKTVNNIKEKIDIGGPFNIKILRDGEPLSLEATFSNNKMLGLDFYGKGDIAASTNSRQAAQLKSSRGGNNGLATASFVLGILSIATGVIGLGFIFAIIAVCLGPGGRNSEHSTLASWGIWLGWITIICSILFGLFGLSVISALFT